jgi:hypothetical protein
MSSEEESAQRFVERHFPEVSRFLARERGDMPVYGPTDPFGDEEHTPDVIVRVDFLMSREQITTALGIAWAEIVEGDRGPESLTVVAVRHEVEAYLSVQALHELGKQMERDQARTFSPESQRVMQLLAEAVDRAYPTAPAPAPAPRTGDRDLLRAVLEALDIPSPATVGDGEVYDRILLDRVMDAVVALQGVLRRGDDAGWSADYLRARLAEKPATGYRTWGEGR